MNLKGSISTVAMILMALLLTAGITATTGQAQSLDWSRYYAATYTQSGYDVCQLADRGFAIAGESYLAEVSYQAWIGKTDANGYLIWSRTLGGTSSDEARAVIETYDGGIVVVGTWYTTDSGSQCFMAKYSSGGTLQWSHRYGGTGYDVAYDVVEASDGGLLMVGRTGSFGVPEDNAYLVKVDAQGNFKWQKFYGGSMYTIPTSIIETSDGGFAITGRQAVEVEAPEAVWLLKVDAAGDSLWAKRHLDWQSGYNRPNGIVETSNGGLAISGEVQDYGDPGFEGIFLLRTDANGNSLGLDYFEGQVGYQTSGGLDYTDDGGYVIAGYKYPTGDYYNPQAYVLRLSSTGDSLWAGTYGGSAYEYAYAVVQDHVGGYVAVGQTSSYGQDQDIYLFRVQRVQPRTLHVKDDYSTIQEAIDECIPGDTILVERGTYRGEGNRDIYVYNGWFVLKSEAGPDRTVIDLQGSFSAQHRFMYMDYYTWNHELIEIEGFTIKNGYETGDNADYGGGMYLYGASPTIRNCVFDNHRGSALRLSYYAAPVFEDCRFTNNDATYGGAANLRAYTATTFTSCSFENNSAGYGGAIYVSYEADLTLTNCTFIDNSSGKGGSIYFTGQVPMAPEEDIDDRLDADATDHPQAAEGEPVLKMERNLITATHQGLPVFVEGVAILTIRCNDIYGNDVGDWIGALSSYLGMNGNISKDPLFCDPLGGSLTVTANSPLTAENSPCGAIGYGEVGCGAIEIALTPSTLTFAAEYGSENPAPVTVALDNLGGNILNWSAEEGSENILMTPVEGLAPDSFDVSVDFSGLDPGDYVDTITIYGDNAVNSPVYLPVTISVIPTNPPVFDSVVTNRPVIEGDTLWIVGYHLVTVNIDFYASDADGTVPTFTSLERPTGSSFITLGTSGVRVSWNPVTATEGLHHITVEASDDWLADTITVAVVINQAPDFVSICPDTSIMEGQTLNWTMAASDDIDLIDDTLEWAMYTTADIGTLVDNGDGTAEFSVTPDFNYVDQQLAYDIQVSDGYITRNYNLNVDVTNRALTVLSMEPVPGGNSDLLVDETIQVQFSEPIQEASLSAGLQISTAKGDVLDYSYDAEQAFILIDGGADLLQPLDTISITLTTDVVDLSGSALDAPYTGTFHTGAVVYPGDANNDGIVDERDILPIGLYWGNQGPVRPDASLTFDGLPAHIYTSSSSWAPLGGVYADADGSGVVDADDICGVADNWDLTHNLGAPDKNTASEMTAGVEESALLQLYTAIVNCPESEGRSAIEGMLVAALGGTAEIELPTTVELSQNYPNPFNPATTIRFYLPEAGTVSLSVYNIVGQRVANLLDGPVNSGYTEILWGGVSDDGTPVASGIYFYRLDTPEGAITKRMMLLK